jgi:sulfur relay (sulfurtransferase) DsrC/TusE family protein
MSTGGVAVATSQAFPALLVRGPFGLSREELELAARREGIWPLTVDHWKVIQFVRAFHRDHGAVPALVRVAGATGFRLTKLDRLFPGGVARTVLEIAGLDVPLDLRSTCPFSVPGGGPSSLKGG